MFIENHKNLKLENTSAIFFYVLECDSQAKDHGNKQDTQDSKDTMHEDCQRNLQEKLDKQQRASLPGIFFFLTLQIDLKFEYFLLAEKLVCINYFLMRTYLSFRYFFLLGSIDLVHSQQGL